MSAAGLGRRGASHPLSSRSVRAQVIRGELGFRSKVISAGFSSLPVAVQFLLGEIDPERMEEPDCPEGSASDRGGERQAASLPLPASFLEFLSENGLDPAVYSMAATIPRYIR